MGSCQSTEKIQKPTIVTKKQRNAPELKKLEGNMLYSRRLSDSNLKCKSKLMLDTEIFHSGIIVHAEGKAQSIYELNKERFKSLTTSKTTLSSMTPKSQEI